MVLWCAVYMLPLSPDCKLFRSRAWAFFSATFPPVWSKVVPVPVSVLNILQPEDVELSFTCLFQDNRADWVIDFWKYLLLISSLLLLVFFITSNNIYIMTEKVWVLWQWGKAQIRCLITFKKLTFKFGQKKKKKTVRNQVWTGFFAILFSLHFSSVQACRKVYMQYVIVVCNIQKPAPALPTASSLQSLQFDLEKYCLQFSEPGYLPSCFKLSKWTRKTCRTRSAISNYKQAIQRE